MVPGARIAFSLGLVLACLESGCGTSVPSGAVVSNSTEEATVSGVVTLRGKPVNNGRVYFSPLNIRRAAVPQRDAAIGKDGRYTIQTLVGDNRVQVDLKELQQAKNRDLADTERMVIVKSGANTIDIAVPPE